MKTKYCLSFEMKISIVLVLIAILIGMLFGSISVEEEVVSGNILGGFFSIFFKIFTHNIKVSIITIALSLILYIGATLQVFLTFFLFGFSLAQTTIQKGWFQSLNTYPHAIIEIVAITTVLAVSYKISSNFIVSVFPRITLLKKTDYKILANQILIAILLFIISGMLESLVFL